MIMIIDKLSIQVDSFKKGDKEEAKEVIVAINKAISHLEGQPQIMGILTIDDSQICHESDPDADEFTCAKCGLVCDIDDSIKIGYALWCDKCAEVS